MPRRAPRYTFATDGAGSGDEWPRARRLHPARSFVVVGTTVRSVKPAGIRASRTILADGMRRATVLVRGWQR